jgi:hypothetical protein
MHAFQILTVLSILEHSNFDAKETVVWCQMKRVLVYWKMDTSDKCPHVEEVVPNLPHQ